MFEKAIKDIINQVLIQDLNLDDDIYQIFHNQNHQKKIADR